MMSDREATLRRRLTGDLTTLCLAAVAGKANDLRTAKGYVLETVDKIAAEREAEVRRALSVRRDEE